MGRGGLNLRARAFGILGGRYSGHLPRLGGAASLFVSGVSVGDIRRFGRRRPVTFREYLRPDDLLYHHSADWMLNSEALTDQSRLEASNTGKIRPHNQFLRTPIRIALDEVANRWV